MVPSQRPFGGASFSIGSIICASPLRPYSEEAPVGDKEGSWVESVRAGGTLPKEALERGRASAQRFELVHRGLISGSP